MNEIEKEQLKMEIQHIFDSGANELRVFEMVKSFIETKNGVNRIQDVKIARQFLIKYDLNLNGYTGLFALVYAENYEEAVIKVKKKQQKLWSVDEGVRVINHYSLTIT